MFSVAHMCAIFSCLAEGCPVLFNSPQDDLLDFGFTRLEGNDPIDIEIVSKQILKV